MKEEARLAELGCIVCANLGYPDSPAEVHHLKIGVGIAQKSEKMIPLCPPHHRTGGYGVAFHVGKEAFEENYGTEMELWKQCQILL